MIHIVRSIDTHAGGAPVRVLTEGMPSPRGKTMAQKREWLRRNGDRLRRGIALEPRGHAGLVCTLLTEPVTPAADAGLLFMDGGGYPALSGSAVIGAATVAIERRLIESADVSRLTFDTVAGTVHASIHLRVAGERRRADTVRVQNVPSYVVAGGQLLRLGSRELRIDLASGGVLYAIVDSEALGVSLSTAMVPELYRWASQVRDCAGDEVAGVIFTGPPQDPEAHLRSAVVAGARVDRSPSVTGTSAVMAVLDAMGLLDEGQTFVHESLIGTLLRGRIARRTELAERPAIVPEIEGSAWITGEHTFLLDEDDPLRYGSHA